MTFEDRVTEEQLDGAFERRLLESAQGDAPAPGSAEAAWRLFAASWAGVAALPGARPPASTAVSKTASAGARGAVAAKWLVIGVISGSSVTALLIRAFQSHAVAPRSAAAPAVSVVAQALPAATAPPVSSDKPAAHPARPERTAPSSTPAPAARTRARKQRVASASSRVSVPPSSATAPRLREQVALLDAARSASASGEWDGALRLIRVYHARFPDGDLAADADVMALDVLAEQKDWPEVASRAADFLTQHPNDPHADHVRALMQGH